MNGLYSDDRCSGIEIGEEAYNFCEDIKVLKEQIEQLQADNAELVEALEKIASSTRLDKLHDKSCILCAEARIAKEALAKHKG